MASVCCCAGQSPASSLSLPSLIPNLGQPWWAKRRDTRGIGKWRWAGRRYCTGTDPVAFYSYRAPRNLFFIRLYSTEFRGRYSVRLPTSGYVKRLVNNKLYSLYLQDVSHLGRQGYLSSYTLEIRSKHTQFLFFSRPYLSRLHTHTTVRKHQQSTNRPTGIEHSSSYGAKKLIFLFASHAQFTTATLTPARRKFNDFSNTSRARQRCFQLPCFH